MAGKTPGEQLNHIWPEVIGLVITKRDGKVNICPINYQAVSTTYEMPLSVCIGLSNDGYTLESILLTGEFTYAYPSREQLAPVLYCGTVSGRDVDKIAETGLQFGKPEHVAAPPLQGAVANYECRLLHHYKVGVFTVVIAEILKIHASNASKLDKIYSLGGNPGEPGQYGAIKAVEILQEGQDAFKQKPLG